MKKSFIACAVLLALLPLITHAQEYRFDPSLVSTSSGSVDLSLFEQGGQLPGTYPVDIRLNGEYVDAREVVFTQGKDNNNKPALIPCLSREQLTRYGIKMEDQSAVENAEGCFPLSAIAGAHAEFNFNSQTLQLSVPQIYLRPQLKGIAPQTLWDNGIPALLLNYQANTLRTEYRGPASRSTQSSYLQLSPGINLGAWRLRNTTNWQQSSGQPGQWQVVNTYAERGLNSIKSRLTLGESYTPSDIFNSVPFLGAMLSSDESMVPGNVSQFSPVVRGVARTQARVEIKQNGYTLYNIVVAPGPFALSDFTTSGSGGDLEVTVWETDGSPQVFTVPWQTPAIALREGYLKYNLMGGQYRTPKAAATPPSVLQATAMYGLPYNLTGFGGVQAAEHYRALSLGLGVSMGDWGALSLDVTDSQGQRREEKTERGRQIGARYSKQFAPTNTTLTVSSERSTSRGYNTLADVLDTWTHDASANAFNASRKRSQTGLTLNQGLGDWGYMTVSGYQSSYWDRPGSDTSFNAGWSIPLDSMRLSLNWSQSRTASSDRKDQVVSLWLSVPLGRWLGGDTNANYRYTHPTNGSDAHSVGLNGSALDRRLQWDVSQQYRPDAPGNTNNGNASLKWNGAYGQLSGNYGYSQSSRQMGMAVAGGVVVHGKGVTLSQPLGDTVALIEAPGASGVQVGSWPGVKTDFRGYTTQSYLQPYQMNTLTLRPENLPEDVDITETDKQAVPTRGAVIPVKFATRTGGRALITLTRADGQAIPYGSLITLNGQAGSTSIVGDGGVAWMTGLPDKGELSVKWTGQQCSASYQLPAKKGPAGIYELNAICR